MRNFHNRLLNNPPPVGDNSYLLSHKNMKVKKRLNHIF